MKVNYALCMIACIYTILTITSHVSPTCMELVYSILLSMVMAGAQNIALGFAGLANLGFTAFIGLGAYFFGFLSLLGVNAYVSEFMGGLFACCVSVLMGMVVLRLRGPFFVVGTVILASVLPNVIIGMGILGGANGMSLYAILGSIYDLHKLLYILLLSSVVITFITFKLLRSRLGYSLMAIREDEDAAQAMGTNIAKSKLIAFALSSLFAGIAGGNLTFRQYWLNPTTSFSFTWTIESTLITVLGGKGTLTGPIFGGILYQILKEVFMRFAPGFQLLIFGVSVIVIFVFAPEGLVGTLRKRYRKLQRVLI